VIGLAHYLILAAVLFAIGLTTVTLKRNAIGILLGVELMLNAGTLNLVAFNRFRGGLDGQIFAAFVIVIAAAEAAVALAICLHYYRHFKTVDVDQADRLRG
jgi:NADH:ubiquinone oxidoreductase subunit K